MKFLIVFGTRPEAIKLYPVIKELKKHSKAEVKICVTAQHREMLDQVLNLFKIVPDCDLNIMKRNQELFDVTIFALKGLKSIFKKEKPDIVIVQGDTTTSFVAGLAAYYLKIPVAHVEAGLRTYNKYAPYPEEVNRHLLGVLADYHFVPTEQAKNNLLKEGIPENRIWITGNTVVDALLEVKSILQLKEKREYWLKYFKEKFNIVLSLEKDGSNRTKLILVTAHRRESFGEGFKNICMALKEIAEKRKDVILIYPVHLNPNVQKPVKEILDKMSNVFLIEPLEYEPFVFLMLNSYLILTDSGGIQEEAPSLGKPVLVMRNTTERPEGIQAGSAKLVGTDKQKIVNGVLELLDNRSVYERMSKAVNPYGDGRAGKRIAKILIKLPIYTSGV